MRMGKPGDTSAAPTNAPLISSLRERDLLTPARGLSISLGIMDKVRFGVAGLGNMGSFHVASFKDIPDTQLTAICDADGARLEKVAKTAPADVKTFSDYRKMLDSGLVDAVIVAVPHYFHGEITLAAWERNIHVLCEKPICVSVREARQINEAYKKHPKLKFGIMFQMRTTPMYMKLRELIA